MAKKEKLKVVTTTLSFLFDETTVSEKELSKRVGAFLDLLVHHHGIRHCVRGPWQPDDAALEKEL